MDTSNMSKILAAIGIVGVTLGTILSLLSILTTNSRYVGTVAYMNGESIQKSFKIQKRQVILGIILIVAGSVLQVIALFI